MPGARKGPSGEFASTDDILNVSAVPGTTATQALDSLAGAMALLTSDDIANASAVAGASVTAALDALLAAIALLQPAPIVSQIGWDGNSPSELLTLVPAGHVPGMYEVSFAVVVRATSLGSPSVTLTWNSPTFGAESTIFSATVTLAAAGTTFRNTSSATSMHRCAAIMSTGAAAITFQLSSSLNVSLHDIYASARLIAA